MVAAFQRGRAEATRPTEIQALNSSGFSAFYWPKQVTRPAEAQQAGKQTLPLDRRSCRECLAICNRAHGLSFMLSTLESVHVQILVLLGVSCDALGKLTNLFLPVSPLLSEDNNRTLLKGWL